MHFKRALQHTIAWKSLNTVLTFFINLMLVRILGPTESGAFFYDLTLLAFFTLAVSWSLESGITYQGSKNPNNVAAIAMFLVPWMLLQGIGLWLILRLVSINLDQRLSWVFIFTNLAITCLSALFYARKWVFAVNTVACVVNAIVLAFLLANYFSISDFLQAGRGTSAPNNLGVWTGDRSQFAVLAYVAGFALQALLLLTIFLSRSGFNWNPGALNPTLVRKLFVYSSIAFASNLLFFLVTRIDYYFVEQLCDAVALSNYVQVSKIGQILVLLPTMMAAVIFPYSSGEDGENYLEKLQLLCRGITLLFAPITGVIALTGSWVFPWLFGQTFEQMYVATLWYLPGFYCLSLIILLTAYLLGKSMLRADLLASLVALVIVITFDLLLIPRWGINGAAAASSIAYLTCLCFLLWIFRKKFNVPAIHFFLPRKTDLQRFRDLK